MEALLFAQVPYPQAGWLSYVVGDRRAGVCAVIDPLLPLDPIEGLLRQAPARVVAVIHTHVPPYERWAGPTLSARTGAPLLLPSTCGVSVPHAPLRHSQRIEVGALRLQAFVAASCPPGAALFLQGHDKLLSGRTLLIGSTAPPAASADGPQDLFVALQELRRSVPEHAEVYPAMFGPRFGLPDVRLTTLSHQCVGNPALAAPDAAALVAACGVSWGRMTTGDPAVLAANRTG